MVSTVMELKLRSMLTKYERTRIIGARALQLSMGATPIIDVSHLKEKSLLSIAEEELNRGVLPIMIIRTYPNGRVEKVSIKELVHKSDESHAI
jgi:DNA-directed RNA polymerase, subunit K/omega